MSNDPVPGTVLTEEGLLKILEKRDAEARKVKERSQRDISKLTPSELVKLGLEDMQQDRVPAS